MNYVGYHALRPGRIHLFCPECKRKFSNAPREEYDPERAVLAQTLCPRCADRLGAKDSTVDYLDARGKRVDWWADAAPSTVGRAE